MLLGSDLDLPDVASVDVDNVAAGEEAVRHLASQGHRNLAYLGVTERIVSSRERREGCERAARNDPRLDLRAYVVGDAGTETGIPLETGRTPEWIAGALDQAFASDRPAPTAMVCWNDLVARQAVTALEGRGRRVPEDVSIVGFDASWSRIPSFRQPLYELGAEAVRLLLDIVDGKEISLPRVRLPAELVVPPASAA